MLALELNARSSQLEGMIREIDNLVSYTDVEPLVADMKESRALRERKILSVTALDLSNA